MRRTALALAFMLLALPAHAGVKLYGSYRYMVPVADSSIGNVTLETQRAGGWGGGVDLGFSSWGSVELDYSRTDLEVHAAGRLFGSVPDADIFSATLNLHLLNEETVDLYFGPMLSYVEMGEFQYATGAVAAVEDELTNGVRAGFDVAVTKRVWLTLGARYMDLEMRRGLSSLEIDPLLVGIGASVRFGAK